MQALRKMEISRPVIALLLWAIGLDAMGHPTVEVKTNFGTFEMELYEDKAPLTVENFMTYVRAGFYRNVLFHRLVPNVLLQGGLYSAEWRLKVQRAPIANEGNNTLSNTKWSVAMAHDSNPNSAATEFFINLGDNSDFDFTPEGHTAYYCVFGEVTIGYETIKKMMEAGIISGGDFVGDQPARDLIIEDIKILTDN